MLGRRSFLKAIAGLVSICHPRAVVRALGSCSSSPTYRVQLYTNDREITAGNGYSAGGCPTRVKGTDKDGLLEFEGVRWEPVGGPIPAMPERLTGAALISPDGQLVALWDLGAQSYWLSIPEGGVFALMSLRIR